MAFRAATPDRGGTVIAQDEATSQHFAMPRAAISTGVVDYVCPISEMGALLSRLVSTPPVTP